MLNTNQIGEKSTLIGSHWVVGEGPLLTSSTPDASQVLWQKKSSAATQIGQAVSAASDAGPLWATYTLAERIAIIEQFGHCLKAHAEELAQILSAETGKPLWEAQTEIQACYNKIAISIRAQDERAGIQENNQHSLRHHPHGVMAVFGPYNFPFHLPNGHIVPALLAGNSIVYKPSEHTPLCAERYCLLWQEAGLPPGVLNLIQGGREAGEQLVKENLHGVLFTGSYTTGKRIHQHFAGKPEVLLALEMGGNNPMIVGQTHDIHFAAQTILHSAFISAGQRCTCTRRLILVKSANSNAIIDALLGLSERVILGNDNQEKEAFMGPVINSHTADLLLQSQQRLIDAGAVSLKTMASQDNSGVYLTPGILDVSNMATTPDEEYFGPLLQVVTVDNFSDALQHANATQFGLAAGLISDDDNEKSQFKTQIKAGIISINAPTAGASSALPFGGIGHSGNHRPSAYYAADYCAWPQAVNEVVDSTAPANQSVRGLR